MTTNELITYGRQSIDEEDIKAVVEVLTSDWLTHGPKVPEFESAIATYCGAQYAVAVNSATSALHIACLALGVGQDDIVWTSPISFVASANCALYCGASVDFVDVEPQSGLISVTALTQKLEKAAQQNKLPKALIPVHLCGHSCDMEIIYSLCQKYNIKIIEDASHCIGGSYQNKKIGGCQYSDITIFSFHPVKIITSAEGGMALTNQPQLADCMAQLRSHGITKDSSFLINEAHGGWYYEQQQLGFNYRMTDIHAALGLSQLSKLDYFVEQRHKLVSVYNENFSNAGVNFISPVGECYSAYHLYILLLDLREQRDALFRTMREKGILVNIHYIPIHLQPYYEKLGFKSGYLPEAEHYYDRCLTIPLFPALTQEQQRFVIDTVMEHK